MASEQRTSEHSPGGEQLADTALKDYDKHAEIEEQIKNLSPEERELFTRALNLALKKRKWMLIGYVCALIAVVVGMVIALYVYGTREPGTFVGWVFVLPPGLAALILYGVGWYVRRIR